MEETVNKSVKVPAVWRNLLARGNRLFGLPLIFLLTFLAFSNIFQNQFVLDDCIFIVSWPLIRDWRNLPHFFWGYTPPDGYGGIYSPLKTLIHAVNYHLFGLNPLGHHVFSILVHFAAIYYVYSLGFLLTRNRTVTFLSALFFALHPIHVLTITFMTASVNTVGIVFLFMAFYYYVRSSPHLQPVVSSPSHEFPLTPSLLKRGEGELEGRGGCAKLCGRSVEEMKIENLPSHQERRQFYVYALLASFVSVFTHELCVALPVLFFWYDFCFPIFSKEGVKGEFSRGNGQYRRIWLDRLTTGLRRAWPFFAIALLYVLCKYLVLGSITRGGYLYGSFYLTMLVIIKVWAKYVFISLAPWVLIHNPEISRGIYSYGYQLFDKFAVLSQSVLDPQVLLSLGILGGILYAAVKMKRRRPLVTFCVGWFFISLLPASNMIPSGNLFADRYLYPGLWGLCLLLGMGCQGMLQRDRNVFGIPWRWVGIGVICFLTIFYGLRTWIRNSDLRDGVTLYERDISAAPRNVAIYKEVGWIYLSNHMFDKAKVFFEKSLDIQPDDPLMLRMIKSPLEFIPQSQDERWDCFLSACGEECRQKSQQ